MAALLTTATLAKWTQNDPTEVAADEFAVDLIDKVSALICWIGGHDGITLDEDDVELPEWTLDTVDGDHEVAPIDVQMIALQVIKRSYENPGQVLQEGNIGPLGGDRVADVQALFADFTDDERARIARYNPNGDPNPDSDAGGVLFTITTTRSDDTTMPQTSPLYVGDDQQVGLAESADPREWMIPMFNPGDPGDDANYDDES